MNLGNIGFYSMYDDRVRNVSEKSQMKRCELIITEYCNFRCSYCRTLNPIIYGDRKIKQLSLEEIKRVIDYWCEDIPLENIRFSGGEPTLHKDIKEVISYSKNKGIKRIAISTNGSNDSNLYRELIDLGVNDLSISLDSCCASTSESISRAPGSFDKVVNNIKEISKLTYVTVGVVLTPDNVQQTVDTINFADDLGVADIRIIPSAQWNKSITNLDKISVEVLDRHPILKFRVNNFLNGIHVRGLQRTDSNKCGLVLDDSVVAGGYHFPCVIFMREGGSPIGRVGPNMREERKQWMINNDCHKDPICVSNCLDVCVNYLNRFREFHPEYF